MKKLMVAMAVVCAAALAQAASVSWQVKLSSATKILDKAGESWTKSGTSNTGMTAYLMLASDTDAFIAALKGGTLSDSNYLDKSTSFAAATGVMSAAQNAPDSAKITTDAQSFNAVLVYTDKDANTYYLVSSSPVKSDARASAGDPASVMFQSGTVFANSSGAWAQASSAAPEPTSGILLLLGVAGLALKRKRA